MEGWDEALHEIGKLSCETVLSPQNATSLLEAVEDLPVLVIVGAEDALVSIKSAQAMASKLVNSVSISLPSLVMLLVICLESWNQIKLNDSLGLTAVRVKLGLSTEFFDSIIPSNLAKQCPFCFKITCPPFCLFIH